MKYYYLDAPEGASPLDEIAKRGSVSLERTLDPDAADITVARRFSLFTPETAAKAPVNICWTHEPYLCLETMPIARVGDHKVQIFNVYNHNVYTDNFFYAARTPNLEPIRSEADLNVPFDKKTVVAVMSGKRGELIVDGKDISFANRRNKFGVRGKELGKVDVYGPRWPDGISHGSTRNTAANRSEDKVGILKNYNFSCCFENTSWDYYTTEKLWESLMARTLPIYSLSDTIVQTFPHGMMQLHEESQIERLLTEVERMPFAEYRDRLNALIEVFNSLPRARLMNLSRRRAQTVLEAFLKTI